MQLYAYNAHKATISLLWTAKHAYPPVQMVTINSQLRVWRVPYPVTSVVVNSIVYSALSDMATHTKEIVLFSALLDISSITKNSVESAAKTVCYANNSKQLV